MHRLKNIEYVGQQAVEYGLIESFSLENNFYEDDDTFIFKTLPDYKKQHLNIDQTEYYLYGLIEGYEQALKDRYG